MRVSSAPRRTADCSRALDHALQLGPLAEQDNLSLRVLRVHHEHNALTADRATCQAAAQPAAAKHTHPALRVRPTDDGLERELAAGKQRQRSGERTQRV